MGLAILLPWRPEPGEMVPCETEALRKINEALPDSRGKFVTWKNREGEWVVSYTMGDGHILDLAFLGGGDRPLLTEGGLASIKSAVQALKYNRGPVAEAQRAIERKNKAVRVDLDEQQREELHYRRFLRRRAGVHYSDHPFFKAA